MAGNTGQWLAQGLSPAEWVQILPFYVTWGTFSNFPGPQSLCNIGIH